MPWMHHLQLVCTSASACPFFRSRPPVLVTNVHWGVSNQPPLGPLSASHLPIKHNFNLPSIKLVLWVVIETAFVWSCWSMPVLATGRSKPWTMCGPPWYFMLLYSVAWNSLLHGIIILLFTEIGRLVSGVSPNYSGWKNATYIL